MSQVKTRKRAAPGASPLSQTHSPETPTFPADPPISWQSQDANSTYLTPYTGQSANDFSTQPNNQLTRRVPNQPIVPIQSYPTINGQWQVADATAPTASDLSWTQYDDLDQRAAAAKRDAEAKRKQIPPFIQKLSSFLDESRNTDLIRWSDSGDSFIVLDEEEFAKTLIPELFKHRNYASFVRQLNMYGFHKKVGLSDNSMRASERKNKNPSEYSNPYFKRGRPNLLWLIQKPKNATAKGGKGGGRAKAEDYDDDVDETFGRENSPSAAQLDFEGRSAFDPSNPAASTISQQQLSGVQQELQSIRDNQQKIAQMLREVRKEHQQLYGQAKAFHDLHEKHDNSINAILTFLATVYSKNLSGQGDNGNMFQSIPEQHRGNIVDMGDVREQSAEANTPHMFKRGPLLLENGQRSPNSPNAGDKQLHSPAIQELSDHSGRTTPSPQLKPQSKDNQPLPQADIMSMLNNASAKNNAFSPNAPMDFSEALSHLQNSGGNTPLTPGQRQNMLQLMGDEYQNTNPSGANINSALASYPSSTPVDPAAQFDTTTDNLDQLGQFIKEQGQSIDNLSTTLTPLSPSGSIPGIGSEVPYSLNPNQDPLDFESFLNNDSYFGDGQNNDGNFNFDGNFDFGVTGDTGNAGTFSADGQKHEKGASNAMGQALAEQDESAGLESPGKKRRVR